MSSLFGKKILLVGCTSNVGNAILQECISCGGTVLGVGRDAAKLSSLRAQNTTVQYFQIDLLDNNSINNCICSIDGIDGLVFSIGGPSFRPIQLENTETFLDAANTLYVGIAGFVSRLISEHRIKDNASIVFISSISGITVGNSGNSSYCAGKAALSGLTKALAIELSPKGIRVNSICPGILEMQQLHDMFPEKMISDMRSRYPLKRFGRPVEIAKLTCFLLSDDCSWLTGQDIIIDGGYSIQ